MIDPIFLPKPKEILKTSILLWTAFALYLVWQISYFWKRRNLYIKSWDVPGPLNLPIIGAAYLFTVRPDEIYDVVIGLQDKYRRGFKLWFGPKLFFVLSQPQHIEKVLSSQKCLEKDNFYKHMQVFLGPALLTAPVSIWRGQRKAIAPCFNQKILDTFVEVFASKSVKCADILEKHIGEELNIFQITSRCTMDIILETAMGVKLDIQNGNSDYGIIMDRMMELTFKKIFQIWYHVDFIWKLSPAGREFGRLKKRFDGLINKIIQEKLETKEISSSSTPQVDYGKNLKPFLDYIIETTEFTVEELRDEVNIFIFAGTDTTSATLSFLFSVLGIYPEVQQKIYEEIIEIMGPDRTPQPNDLPLMKYTEKVIKETLRFFPVVGVFARSITEDMDLGDINLPEGSSVFFGTVFLHRNPELWEDPLKFDPDRFSPENMRKIPTGAYMPFSLGPRNCMGMKYAYMSMKSILANVVRRLKFRSGYKSVADIEIKSNLVMRYKKATKLYAEKRTH